MKKFLLPAFAFLAFSLSAQTADTTKKAANPKFTAAMEKQVNILDTAFNPATLQNCFNSLERISNAEKKEWLPDYYMAYCLIMESYSDSPQKADEYCDKAMVYINRADSLKGDASEIFVMRAMCSSARIMVDPRSRGAKYGKESSAFLDSAQAHNAANPRIYLMRGQGLYYTPPMFGGGKKKALPVLEEASKKYDTFVPASGIHPRWGKGRTQQLIAECNK